MTNQLKADVRLLSVPQAIMTNISNSLDEFAQALIASLNSLVQILMEKAKSSAERRIFAIPGLSLVPDFNQIKELFLQALKEIKLEHLIVG